MDFDHALVKLNGVQRKVAFFVMALPYSDAVFMQAFEHECTETFWEGHVQAFGFFGGVPPPHTGPLPPIGAREKKAGCGGGWGHVRFWGLSYSLATGFSPNSEMDLPRKGTKSAKPSFW